MQASSFSKIWNEICEVGWGGDGFSDFLLNNLVLKLGSGIDIFFWSDVWILTRPLSQAFPRLFSIFTKKDNTVAEIFSHSSE